MSNVLSEEQKQQVIALGRLGWSLRRIERETGVRRETISAYLKEAGVELRPPRGRRLPAKPASRLAGVTPDPEVPEPAGEATSDSPPAKPASQAEEVTTDSGGESVGETTATPEPKPGRSPSASACEPYVETIEVGLARGRNAKAIWQDLVDVFGFAGGYQSVKRFIRKFRGQQQLEACVVIETAPGEELQVDYGTGPMVRDGHTGKYRRTRLLIGGVPAQLVYSVLAPQFVSEYQIAVLPAARTPTGDAVPIQIQIGGVTTSSQVTIAVVP